MITSKIQQIVNALTTPVIAIVAIIYVFKTLLFILSGEAKADKDIIIYIVGFLTGTAAASIFYYYFGSSYSHGSKTQSKTSKPKK